MQHHRPRLLATHWVVIGDGYELSSAYIHVAQMKNFLRMQQMRILILLIIVLLEVVLVLCARAGLALQRVEIRKGSEPALQR